MSDRGLKKQWAHEVEICFFQMGADTVFMLTGGEAHIGAAATAYYERGAIRTKTIALPGHLEEELALELAVMGAQALKCTVAVVAGIHYDQPTKRDIEDIVTQAKWKMKQILTRWKDRTESRRSNES